jgi:hypothetical protein
VSSEKNMDCTICENKRLGTVYYLDFGPVCIKCDAENRDHPVKIPSHIPDEQHVKYKINIYKKRLKT